MAGQSTDERCVIPTRHTDILVHPVAGTVSTSDIKDRRRRLLTVDDPVPGVMEQYRPYNGMLEHTSVTGFAP